MNLLSNDILADRVTLRINFNKFIKILILFKLFKTNKFFKYITPVAGGIMGGLSISSYLWIIFMPVSLSILWSGFDRKYSNFLWGFSLILISHYWLLYLHPLTWLGFSWVSSILISNIILISCSLLGGFFVILWGLVGSKIISKNDIFSQKESFVVIRVTFVSLLWALGEVFISQTSFLWIGIGESLIPGDLYLAGLARLIGSPGVCFIVIFFGFWIFFIFEKWKRKLNFNKEFFVGIVIIFFLHLMGGYLIQPDNDRNSLYPIAIWQTNIPTREKLFQKDQKTMEKIIVEQNKALSNDAQLLVVPEGTLKTNFSFQEPSKINTLIGGFRIEKNSIRNSLLAYKEGDKFYSTFLDKYRLVPLGERIPMIFQKYLNLSSLRGIEPGNQKRYFAWENSPPFAAIICYEITDGLKIKNAVQDGSKFILAIANLDPYPSRIFNQYLSLVRMRSIENNIDTVISSNTGPSGLIRNDGRIDKLMKSNIEDNEVVYTHLLNKKTTYTHYGIWPLIITFIFLSIYIIFF